MPKKYLVHPGAGVSKPGGNYHAIGFQELCGLYRVDPADCLNVERFRYVCVPTGLIDLYPNMAGVYVLPEVV